MGRRVRTIALACSTREMKFPALPPRRIVLWWALSAFPLALVVATGAYLSYHYNQLVKESRDSVDRRYETLDRLREVFESVEDAETGQRGFLITGDESYLEPFNAAMKRGPRSYFALQKEAGAGALADAQVAVLERLIAEKLSELQHGIEVRRRDGFAAARAEVVAGHGKVLMDAVRSQVATMAKAERRALQSSGEEVLRKQRDTLRVAAAVAAVSIALRIAIALLLVHLRRRGTKALPDGEEARSRDGR
jgi:CHASE3 domain sensor protein